MKFEINERVKLVKKVPTYPTETGTPGIVVKRHAGPAPYQYQVLFDDDPLPLWLAEDELESAGVVNNPPAHSSSITFFEPIPDAELAAEVEDIVGLGMKYDGDKPRMDLLLDGMPGALEQVASILTFGAKKYADHSWQTVPNGPARYKAALLRHLTAHAKGELNDPDSGMAHLAHAACNALFILQLEVNNA